MFYPHSSSSQSFFLNAPTPDHYTRQAYSGYSPYYDATGQIGFNPPIYDWFENRLVYPSESINCNIRQIRPTHLHSSSRPVDSTVSGPIDSPGTSRLGPPSGSQERWEINNLTGRPIKIGGRIHKRISKRKNREFTEGSPSGTGDPEKDSSEENGDGSRSAEAMEDETESDRRHPQTFKKHKPQTNQNSLVQTPYLFNSETAVYKY